LAINPSYLGPIPTNDLNVPKNMSLLCFEVSPKKRNNINNIKTNSPKIENKFLINLNQNYIINYNGT